MRHYKILLLCAVISFTGCSANTAPEIYHTPVLSPSRTIAGEISATPLPTPVSITEINTEIDWSDSGSNIENGGFAVSDGQSIYLASDKLYRMDLYCNKTTELLNMPDISFLNADGDFLYCVSATYY